MKTSYSAKFTAKEIRDKSSSWLRFIHNSDRAHMARRTTPTTPKLKVVVYNEKEPF